MILFSCLKVRFDGFLVIVVSGAGQACCVATIPRYGVTVSPPVSPAVVVARQLPAFSTSGITGMSGSLSQVVVSPVGGCAPCTYRLVAAPITVTPQAGSLGSIDVTAIDFAVVDLGPIG